MSAKPKQVAAHGHPGHVVSMTRDYVALPADIAWSDPKWGHQLVIAVATCRCGWVSRTCSAEYRRQDAAIDCHWDAAKRQNRDLPAA